jgi:hypothetical protein
MHVHVDLRVKYPLFLSGFNNIWKYTTYAVRLLSFRIDNIKSICVKEMTLWFFSFRHTSLLTVHTGFHGHTASGCFCGSRPLQWCLMYLSRFPGCPKSSQRDAPTNGISLFGTKINQRVLNLANTEGGRSQSLLKKKKTAWRLSRCRMGRCRAKETSHQIHIWQDVIHKEFVPEGETINAVYYKRVTERLLNRIRRVRSGLCKSGDWFLLARQRSVPQRDYPQAVFGPKKSDCARPHSTRFGTCWSHFVPKSKIPLDEASFYSISDIQKAVTSTLNTVAKDDFWKGI